MKDLTITELKEIEGGKTSFAYDVGTFLRCVFYKDNPVMLGITIYNWWVQQ